MRPQSKQQTTRQQRPQSSTKQSSGLQLIQSENNLKKLQNTRMIDNHFDSQVHKFPWRANGVYKWGQQLQSFESNLTRYIHSDSGLAHKFENLIKLNGYIERSELNSQIEQMTQTIRNFKEFDSIKEGDVIITIEYCTNCQQHKGTTRHDEEKYYNLALQVRDDILAHFPVAKVLLKPLLFDEKDTSKESLYLQRRIGAFEVQICLKQNGNVKKDVIFSKLNARKWPKLEYILEQVSKHMRKCDLLILLKEPEEPYDKSRSFAEKDAESQINKVKGIQVYLTTVRTTAEEREAIKEQMKGLNASKKTFFSFLNTAQDINYTGTIQCGSLSSLPPRPLSSVNSFKTKRPISSSSTKTRGFSAKKKLALTTSTEEKPGRYILTTGENGEVLFKDLPLDVYQLEIQESKDFQQESRIIDLFQMNEEEPDRNESFFYDIELSRQYLAFCQILLDEGGVLISEAEILIEPINIQSEDAVPALIREKNGERGKYEFVIDPGQYYVTVKRDGFKDVTRDYHLKSGTNEIKIDLKQAKLGPGNKSSTPIRPKSSALRKNLPEQGPKEITIHCINAYTAKPVQDLSVKLLDTKNTNKSIETKTNQQGDVIISLDGNSEGELVIEGKDFFPIRKQYGKKSGMINLYQIGNIPLPIFEKPKGNDDLHVLIIQRTIVEIMELICIQPDGQKITKGSNRNVIIDNKQQDGIIWCKCNSLQQSQGIFRIYAEIKNIDYFSSDFIEVYLISSQGIEQIEIPLKDQQIKGEQKWDIGFIKAPNPQLIVMNSILGENIQMKQTTNLKSYQDFLKFLKNSTKYDLQTMLGYNDALEREQVNGDVFIKKASILKALDKYGFEDSNISYIFDSARDNRGYVSFKQIEAKLKRVNFTQDFVEDSSEAEEKDESENSEYDDNYDDKYM